MCIYMSSMLDLLATCRNLDLSGEHAARFSQSRATLAATGSMLKLKVSENASTQLEYISDSHTQARIHVLCASFGL